MSAIATSTGRAPGQRCQRRGDQRGHVGRRDSPLGTDLHPDPALVDSHAWDGTAGKVGGDLAKRAAVQRGYPGATPDHGGDGVDVDAVNQRSPGRDQRGSGHDTREEGGLSWPPSEGR